MRSTRGICRLLAGFGSAVLSAMAPSAGAAATDIAGARHEREAALLTEFLDLLRIPNVASDPDIARNAQALADMMAQRGLAPRLLRPRDAADAPPLVYGEWRVPGAKRTLVLYAHYDGQPVNPAEWATTPFSPTLRAGTLNSGASVIAPEAVRPDDSEVRVYARGAADDKGGVMAILGAIDVLRALHRAPSDNLKIVFEGEEEAGSSHLGDTLRENASLFAGQLWIVCDGPLHQSGRRQVIYGARGDLNVSLAVYGANRVLHSGHYGNWAPNPALRLARLLTSMKDESGKVLIPGWYDGVTPLGPRERQAIDASVAYDDTVRRQLGLAATDSNLPLNEAIALPSLNINGLQAGNVGAQASNMIPDRATAELDLRLAAGNDPDRQFARLHDFVAASGYYVIDREPNPDERQRHVLIATLHAKPGSYAAARTPMDDPLARSIAEAVQAASPQPIVELPTSGGSLPLSIIDAALSTRSILIGIANYDNNQHGANENLKLANLWQGIDLYAAILMHGQRSPDERPRR